MSAPPAPRWWQTRWFVAAMVALAALPLVWPDVPPLVDLPGHMGRYRVQLDRGAAPWLGQWYGFEWALIGNLGVDLLVVPLAPVLGLELAAKLIVAAIPALTVAGMLAIAREVHGRVPPTALFALPLAYSQPFHFGFVNFALATALALVAFAGWLRLGRSGRLGLRAALFAPVAAAIWVAHTFGWGVLGILAFSAELVRQHESGRRWPAAAGRAALNCLPMALPLLPMLMWRSGQPAGSTGDWFDWTTKLLWVVCVLRDRWFAFDAGAFAALLVVLGLGARARSARFAPALAIPALALLAAFVLLPRIVFNSSYADMRLAPFMLALGILAIGPRPGEALRGAGLIAALGLAFVAARTGATTWSFALYDRVYDRELAALDHLPEGARVAGFVGEPCYNQWMLSRVQHLPSMAIVRRRAFANDQWSVPGTALLTVRYAAARGFATDPSQIVTEASCPRDVWRTIDMALAGVPRDAFDHVWLIAPHAYDPRLAGGLVPVWRSGRSVLFRIER